jgi:hypothetical protein
VLNGMALRRACQKQCNHLCGMLARFSGNALSVPVKSRPGYALAAVLLFCCQIHVVCTHHGMHKGPAVTTMNPDNTSVTACSAC